MGIPEDYGYVSGDITTEFIPEGCELLETLYTQEAFNTLCDSVYNYVTTSYNLTVSASLQSFMKEYLWDWYHDNYVAFSGDTEDIIRTKFELRLKMAYADHWRWLQADWAVYDTALRNYEAFANAGKVTHTNTANGSDNRTVNLTDNGTGSVFHKEADTPTAIQAADTFIDSYTNAQSKDTSTTGMTHTGTDNLSHNLNGTDNTDNSASVEALLRTLSIAKQHTADDITNLFGNCFITVYEV